MVVINIFAKTVTFSESPSENFLIANSQEICQIFVLFRTVSTIWFPKILRVKFYCCKKSFYDDLGVGDANDIPFMYFTRFVLA